MNAQEKLCLSFVIVLVLLVAGVEYNFFKDFKQLPSPLFGGDGYYHLATINHLYNGGSFFESAHYEGEYQHYPAFFHWAVAKSARLFEQTPIKTAIFFPIIITTLSMLVTYFVLKGVTGNCWVACLCSFGFVVLGDVASTHPTSFALRVLVPLLCGVLYLVKSVRGRLWAGIVLGITGLSHTTAFLGGLIFLALLIFRNGFVEGLKPRRMAEQWLRKFWFFMPVGLIGGAIAMLYWFAPMFVYKGVTLNRWQDYSGIGVNALNAQYVLGLLKTCFLSFTSLMVAILCLLAIVGAVYAIKRKNFFCWLVFLAGFLGAIHPLILLGFNVGFYRFPTMFLTFAQICFVGMGVLFLWNLRENKVYRAVVFVSVLCLFLFQGWSVVEAYDQNQWTQVGRTNTALFGLMSASAWYADTVEAGVVLCDSVETCFAFHSLTGWQVVGLRRTHASPFVDAEERFADMAVMLYGNNSVKRQELFDKYGVSYYYLDYFSSESLKQCLGAWQNETVRNHVQFAEIVGDSCLQVANVSLAPYLAEYGVQFVQGRARLDPSNTKSPVYDLLVIYPNIDELGWTSNLSRAFEVTDSAGAVGAILLDINEVRG